MSEQILDLLDFLEFSIKSKMFKTKKALKINAFAERKGFEPSIQLPAYYLSRVAPSTTRTPLYVLKTAKIGYFIELPNSYFL